MEKIGHNEPEPSFMKVTNPELEAEKMRKFLDKVEPNLARTLEEEGTEVIGNLHKEDKAA